MRLFQRSFFDKLILFYIILGSVCFWGMVYFTNHNITRLLINERTTSLQSQARLIATQYAKDYFEGDLTNVELLEQLDSLKTLLGIDIWITDKNGWSFLCKNFLTLFIVFCPFLLIGFSFCHIKIFVEFRAV